MGREVCIPQSIDSHMRVDLRRRDGCVSQQFLHDAQVGTVLRFVGQCPYGWLHANGQYIVRDLYPDLYAVLQSLAGPEQQQSGAAQ